MLQVVQDFKSGKLSVEDVPPPALDNGQVLVANLYSVISSGTERSTIEMAKASALGKARKRPELVKQVLDNVKREGVLQTWDKVQKRLSSPKALGYSSCGVVLKSLAQQKIFSPGDIVACGGQDYASHSEIIAVPERLAIKVPKGVGPRLASFSTLGAIALQGIRQSDIRFGERVCVIGLGTLGQLTCHLLAAAGCHVFGVDPIAENVDLLNRSGPYRGFRRDAASLDKILYQETQGYGMDAVIITAGTSSNDPVASIDKQGLVTGNRTGAVKITATNSIL